VLTTSLLLTHNGAGHLQDALAVSPITTSVVNMLKAFFVTVAALTAVIHSSAIVYVNFSS
jgi:hypothetical protein